VIRVASIPTQLWDLSWAPRGGSAQLFVAMSGAAAVIGCALVLEKLCMPSQSGGRRVSVQRAQQLVSVLGNQILPAMAAGFLVYAHAGGPREALLVFLVFFAGCWGVTRFPYPLHLMPTARVLLAVAGPAIGGAVLILFEPAIGIPKADLAWGAVLAMVIAILGRWNEIRFEAARPITAAVIGSSTFASSFAERLDLAGIRSLRIAGWLDCNGSALAGDDGLLGPLASVRAVVIQHRVELLIVAPPENGTPGVAEDVGDVCHEVIGACLDLPVRMIDAHQLYEELLGHVPIGAIDAAWFRYIMHPRFRPGPPLFKRLLDLAVALVGGLLALPIIALSALAIKVGDRGPLIYRQRRVGEGGREFELLKLRTMQVDSESDGQARWCSEDDTRVTGVGRLLRRTHLDELPQLWNVLRGEMAIVGPRPERPELISGLERQFPHYERRHLVKPGITGWAQIRCGYAGSESGTAWKLSHDLYYLKHRSLLAELVLMVETAAVVLGQARELPAPWPGLVTGPPAPEVLGAVKPEMSPVGLLTGDGQTSLSVALDRAVDPLGGDEPARR
jgi:exopolysaccharide biosynthesis polyprenyl glycosylphosphotransferase